MPENAHFKKAVRQHLEIEQFFTGFTVRAPAKNSGKSSATKEPEELSIVAAELQKIADETRQCRRCPLGASRSNAVPGEGNPAARIVFVGEGPGAEEDAQGRPFVGRAGQLLDRMIAAMGLKRSEVFICNVLKCRPPDNRDPRPEEIISCLPFLQKQLELMKPKVIVALGAHAARSLLETNKPIGQLRGRFQEYVPGLGAKPIKLMPTFHPAYLLRNYSPENRRKVWEDLQKVMTELKDG